MASSTNQEPLISILKNIEKYNKNIIYIMKGSCAIILNCSSPIINEKFEMNSDPSTMMSETGVEMNLYFNRLKTFHNASNQWRLDFITPRQMANAGFYYLGKQDRVRCTYCSKEFDYWCPGDDPLEVHKQFSPQCSFFTEDQGYDVCGLHGSPSIDSHYDKYAQDIENYIIGIGAMQHIRSPIFKSFATLESRIKTFEKCQIQLKQSIYSFSEAGLFYTGHSLNDEVMCFNCGQGIGDWEDNDLPMSEHARWSPSCIYLWLNRGSDFVNEVSSSRKDEVLKNNQKKLSTLTVDYVDQEDASTLAIKSVIDSMVNNVERRESNNNNEMVMSPAMDSHPSQQNLNSVPDSLLCKICFKNEIKVVIMPCCHATQCAQCILALDDCAICRRSFSMCMRIHVYQDKSNDDDPIQLPCSSSVCDVSKPSTSNQDLFKVGEAESHDEDSIQFSSSLSLSDVSKPSTSNQNLYKVGEYESNDEIPIQLPSASPLCDISKPISHQNLCKVCGNAEMGAVFIPCGHVYACFNCSIKMHDCPVCSNKFLGMMQIYL